MQSLKNKFGIFTLSISALLLAGCNATMPQQNSYNSYPTYNSYSSMETLGVVISTRAFQQPKTQYNNTGAVVGGVAGGVLGNQVGKGSGRTAATVLGALVGAGVGANVNAQQHYITMYEVTVRSETGQHFTIQTQDSFYYNGRRVAIKQQGNNVEIRPI